VIDSLKGTVLFHKMATTECGFLSTASLTLIETEEGDTIRVLDLCNTKKDFRTGSFVTLRAQRKPDFSIDILPFDPKACAFKRTCFGTIFKEKLTTLNEVDVPNLAFQWNDSLLFCHNSRF
jgi:hypothetical protein